MTKKIVTDSDVKNFFAAYGLTDPLDLSKAKEPGRQLRETVEGCMSQMSSAAISDYDYLRADQLKKTGASMRVFNALAWQDGETDLTSYELAQGLERAELLRLPASRDVAALWQNIDSIQWAVVRHGRQSELANYLDTRRNDNGRRSALTIMEEWAQKNPSDFEGTFAFDLRISDIILASKDSAVRDRFLKLFQTPAEVSGEDLLEGFDNLERDFQSILEKLKAGDLATAQELLKNSNPRKVAFGLLCAKKLLSASQFKAVCRLLSAERPSLSSKTVYSYGTGTQTSVTVGELLRNLVRGKSTLSIQLAGLGL